MLDPGGGEPRLQFTSVTSLRLLFGGRAGIGAGSAGPEAQLGDAKDYLIDNLELDIIRLEEEPISVELAPAGSFYRAEEYHQQYEEKGGYGACRLR